MGRPLADWKLIGLSAVDINRWAAGLSVPAYAIDDETAIKVVDDTVEVVSEGHWKLFAPDTPGGSADP